MVTPRSAQIPPGVFPFNRREKRLVGYLTVRRGGVVPLVAGRASPGDFGMPPNTSPRGRSRSPDSPPVVLKRYGSDAGPIVLPESGRVALRSDYGEGPDLDPMICVRELVCAREQHRA